MPRDMERARDGTSSAAAMAPDAASGALPEDEADRLPMRARSRTAALTADPELLRYRNRLDQQIASWRKNKPVASLAIVAKVPKPSFHWRPLLVWITPIAICGAAFGGWWIVSAPTARAGE